MSESILVVEYEPRYTDRVRQALAGQPFTPTFAKDGEEAVRALEGEQPRLIVLSSVVPKISTTELIRAIRGRVPLRETPILLTVSGYNGKSPQADAQRVGASDILPKPYSETEFLGKVQQMLGVRGDAPAAAQMTSADMFGDLVDRSPKKPAATKASDDVDKMLADTLAGMMPAKRSDRTPPAPQQAKRSSSDLDKMLADTLSGLGKDARRTSGGTTVRPPSAAAEPAAHAQPPSDNSVQIPDRVPVSQPVIPHPVAPEPPKAAEAVPAPPPFTVAPPDAVKHEEEEPADGIRFGQYILIERIAVGGMAEVWKARMRGVEGFQKIVAIKKILPHLSDNQDFIEMFVDEAKLAAQLNHNNIIHIYDLGKIQSSYYIAMEYIDGFDLKTILRRGQERDHPITVELALFIASKIAAALDYAHRKKDFEEREMGLVHRDVSPQNVLISQEGDIKLCDFGIAKAASKASHTQAGALKGKLQYMAPEQAWGRSIDRRSDIFALATVLFEMLTGRKLFTGDNEISILEQVREARVTAPSLFNDEVSPEIDQIVLKALQKDPANRYQTAGEMARDIDAVLYSFRPTPTSADLAIYMHRLSTPEPVMPEPEPEAVVAAPVALPPPLPIHAPVAAPVAPVAAAPFTAAPFAAAAAAEEERPRKKTGLIVAAAVALLAVAGAAAFMLMQRPAAPAQPVTGSVAAARATAPPTAPAPALTTPDPAAALGTETVAPDTAIDPSLVDQEVQRRIAAARERLEAQARAQQPPPQTATVPPSRPAAAPPQVVEQQPAPAAPVAQPESRPAPPVQQAQEQAPPPQAAQQPAAPQQTAPAPQRAREGDLIATGTEGLTPPRLVRRGTVQYPQVARMQRVEGTVLASVLVSETGQVLDVRIIRGVNRPVGLNEAAEQTMRRSSFAPGTKDGVRVKSWVTVPVEFKL